MPEVTDCSEKASDFSTAIYGSEACTRQQPERLPMLPEQKGQICH